MIASRDASWAEFARGIAGFALASFATAAWSAEALFVPLDEAEASRLAHSVSVQPAAMEQSANEPLAGGRTSLVRIDRQRLFRTIHEVALRGPVSVVLNVAEGLEIEVMVERSRRTLSGHSLSGRVVDASASAMTFATNGEVLVGTVWTPGANYEILPLKDGVHVFRKVARSVLPLGAPISPAGGKDKSLRTTQGNTDGDAVVDVLVVWTPKARANIESTGGGEKMPTGVDLLVAWTNDAFERSGTDVRLNLVGAEEIDYVEEDISSDTHLRHLAHPSDGYMDDVHERRDALGADLVSLLPGTGTVGGQALLGGAFSLAVLGLNPSFGALAPTFAHEVGHNMGLSHDRYRVQNSLNEGALRTFSYGYVNSLAFESGEEDDCWVTIMAYYDRCQSVDLGGSEVPYFSTPDLRHPDDGAPLGVPKSSDDTGPDGPADAVRALDLSYPRVVAFRPGRTEDGGTPDTATQVVANSSTFATLPDRDDVDYFRVAVPEAGWLRVETTGRCDTQGQLITQEGETIAEDNIGGTHGNFLIEAELEAGVYFIKVQQAQGSEGPSSLEYTLRVSFNARSAADDHGDGVTRASAMAVPSTIRGELQSSSDTDYFSFEVSERGVVRVATSGRTDVVGVLTSEDGAVELADDDGGPQTNFLIVAKLSPGLYFVAVRGYEGTTGAYSLEVSQTSDADDHADALSGATDLAIGTSGEGEIEVALDRDLFRIAIPAEHGPGQLWIESEFRCNAARTHCDADVAGELLQDGGKQIAGRKRDGSAFAHGFVLGAQVAPGPYFLRVTGLDPFTTGAYEVQVSFIPDSRTIPLFLSASRAPQQGFARIINRSRRDGEVVIHAVDDAGRRFGPVTLSLAAGRTAHFNSEDLEMGNAAKGLPGGIGAGTGDWRLLLETELDIEALAYVRTRDGFLTSMHDSTTNWTEALEDMVAIFNPASNRNQRSKLRLTNQAPGSGRGEFNVRGFDDKGWTAPRWPLEWLLSAGESLTMSVGEMEPAGRFGSLGDGTGKWRLSIASTIPIKTMNLVESPTGHLTNLTSRRSGAGRTLLPFFLSASDPQRESFARIINRGTRDGTVAIHAVDDAGQRYGPAMLSLPAKQTAHFNSGDLERGNAAKGLVAGVGAGDGDWRLRFDTDLDIEALAFVRTQDGFLTGMNAVVPKSDGRLEVVFFNPASNQNQVSRLRLVNPAAEPATISIRGVDDAGVAAPEGNITLTLPAGAATAITAQQLEVGADHFAGRLGDGEGKWQLFIEADQDIQAMSLMESEETGHLTNLSSGTAVR